MNLKLKKEIFKFKIKFTRVYGYIKYIRTTNDEPISREPMDKDKQTVNSAMVPTLLSEEQCQILLECHKAYQEDVICGSMSYENFVSTFFGMSGASDDYRCVRQMFREHQPIIEYRFKSSAFSVDDSMAMLQEFEHCNSFFDRSLIDIQLKPIIPKLEKEGVLELLCQCANTTAMFHCSMDHADMKAILTGTSKKDYGIYFVSHFAYLMKGMERNGLIIQHWQSMVWNLSRIVYKGRYLNQHLISSTVHNLGFLKRRPWQYDTIDEFLHEIRRL